LAFANKKASGLSEALSGFRGDRRDLVPESLRIMI
jgi:hypothetical protein